MYQECEGYLGLPSVSIKRLSDGTVIPIDEGNSDYKEFLLWISDGNSIIPLGSEEV